MDCSGVELLAGSGRGWSSLIARPALSPYRRSWLHRLHVVCVVAVLLTFHSNNSAAVAPFVAVAVRCNRAAVHGATAQSSSRRCRRRCRPADRVGRWVMGGGPPSTAAVDRSSTPTVPLSIHLPRMLRHMSNGRLFYSPAPSTTLGAC